MDRFPQWRSRLNGLIEVRRHMPFDWGKNDCCLWAADAVLTMTGTDFAEEYRGKYETQLGAFRALKRIGGVDNPDALAHKLLGEPLHPSLAQVGDVVSYRSCLGIGYGMVSLFVGQEQLVGAAIDGHEGLISIPTLSVDKAYRV